MTEVTELTERFHNMATVKKNIGNRFTSKIVSLGFSSAAEEYWKRMHQVSEGLHGTDNNSTYGRERYRESRSCLRR